VHKLGQHFFINSKLIYKRVSTCIIVLRAAKVTILILKTFHFHGDKFLPLIGPNSLKLEADKWPFFIGENHLTWGDVMWTFVSSLPCIRHSYPLHAFYLHSRLLFVYPRRSRVALDPRRPNCNSSWTLFSYLHATLIGTIHGHEKWPKY